MALVRDSFIYGKSEAEAEAYREKIKKDRTLVFDEPFLMTKAEAEEAKKKAEEEKE